MKYFSFILFNIIFIGITLVESRRECIARKGHDSPYCVCNTTYCDDLDPIVKQPKGTVLVFETNKKGDRLKQTVVKVSTQYTETADESIVLTIDKNTKYQKIIGFGGAFTDASGLNLKSLPQELATNVIKDYFSSNGIEYSMGRVPIAGCDFSPRAYTYNDQNDDFELKTFALQKEDEDYKIPYIKMARNMSSHALTLFASPWASPAWMKTNGHLNEGGLLIGNPAGYGQDKLNLMVYDDYGDKIVNWADVCFNDKETAQYINGIAYHCYGNGANWGDVLEKVHQRHPDQFVISSECCQEFKILKAGTPVRLGVWDNSESYTRDIMINLEHWTRGWVEWNLVLDMYGQPNWAHFSSEAPILVNSTGKEYYKDPKFYILGHFSKFLAPDSVRVSVKADKTVNGFDSVAFVRPDNAMVVIVYNQRDSPTDFIIKDQTVGQIKTKIESRSVQTYIYWN
ncbi:unnamed protein product [Oppiella nova]|uniref:Glucosylceramidase n=1 Tax=Oppiella nova TaxID=334625 RepID=A0A7R9LNI0_9ACAR|nr:unnamed protein product [Oppiella nova]CAG2165024.1 unnamed protein product [Oppiella nova]